MVSSEAAPHHGRGAGAELLRPPEHPRLHRAGAEGAQERPVSDPHTLDKRVESKSSVIEISIRAVLVKWKVLEYKKLYFECPPNKIRS